MQDSTSSVLQSPMPIITAVAPKKGIELVLCWIGPTTVVAIHPDTTSILGHWLDGDNLSAVREWAEGRNTEGFNIYFTANQPRVGMSKKPAKVDIEMIRCVFADVDAKDGRTMDQAAAVVDALPQRPSFIIGQN